MNRTWVPIVCLAILATACTAGGGGSTTSTLLPTSTSPPSSTTPPGSTQTPSTTRPTVPVPTYVDRNGFNDHTVPAIPTTPEYFALARTGVAGQSVVKFTIADVAFDPAISWMDSNFYNLHDEWYWFRLLNGAEVPGSDEAPMPGRQFATVAAVYDWARAQATLPYELAFVGSQSVGSRLYSKHFYDLALEIEPRVFAPGSLLYFPTSPNGGGERWVVELEYHDDPTPDEVALVFRLIAATVPAEIGDNLEWVLRSPEQEAVARQMIEAALPFADRVVHYRDLVAPGEVAVYNEGIAAGRLLIIGPGGKPLTDATSTDILLVENVPDFLPPGKALISSAPQTPLAHVNLLARDRGIPNASQAGILQDAGVQQAARVRAPAIVRASAAAGLEIVLITEDQYDLWLDLQTTTPIGVATPDLAGRPHLVDLATIAPIASDADLEAWRPVIGGKAAGFVNMRDAGITMPPDPMVITVRPYFEHLAKIEAALDAMLADTSFRDSRRTRFLMLEGAFAYAAFYTAAEDREFAEAYAASHPRGTPIGDILWGGGFKQYLRDVPMSLVTLSDITSGLQAKYSDYALSQGLRFRSSSSVEDIEGFTGAGLYESNTGYFRPDLQLDADDQKKSIEWAIKRTWASYWGIEAFEERRRENVVHKSGGMAILVHARFDDPLELSNGVFTFTISPAAGPDSFVMVLNAQDGAVSVSNPDPGLGALPEQTVVRQSDGGSIQIERVAASNLVPVDERVVDNEQLVELFTQARAVALLWRDRVNADLPPSSRVETLTLDFEFREMDAGWPTLRNGLPGNPPRLVIKQARSLEPGLRNIPQAVRDLPVPRDVLARARLVERVECGLPGGEGTAAGIAVYTDALIVPDVGFADDPFLITDDPALRALDIAHADCEREILFSTPEQLLVELLAAGELLNLSQ